MIKYVLNNKAKQNLKFKAKPQALDKLWFRINSAFYVK